MMSKGIRIPMSKHSLQKAAPFDPISAPDFLPPSPACANCSWNACKTCVAHAFNNVALFRGRMEERGLEPGDIQSLDDIARLPFCDKTDLRDGYPFGLFATPMSEIVRLHASTGTTGKPIVVAYTQQDVDVWTNVMCRSFAACGLHRGDIIQNAYGYGLFTGGLGAHYGGGGAGRDGHPHFRRQHPAPNHGAQGFQRHRHLLHAELFSAHH